MSFETVAEDIAYYAYLRDYILLRLELYCGYGDSLYLCESWEPKNAG